MSMKTMHSLLLTIAALIGLITASCISDDIDMSPSVRLQFSVDTLSFDTVFTGVGTPTARLLVYNRGNKGVKISSIRFKEADSDFRMNVDGQSGRDFSDIEIRAKDSIYVFVECTLPEQATSSPMLVEDAIEFVTNGTQQSVLLQAWGQNVTRLRNVRVTQDMTLTAEQPYVVFDSLVVDRGATLRIEPGAQVLFHDKGELKVHGRLEAVGTVGKMIALRGDRLDNVLPDVGFDIMAGQWEGVTIGADSYENRMEYVDMRSTKRGLVLDSCAVSERSKLLIVNSWLHNSQGSVLTSKYGNVEAYGCVFSESPEAVVSLTGGTHKMVQCTIANNYLFSAILEPLLCMYHVDSEHTEAGSEGLPYMVASFENCIIYGLGSDLNIGDLDGSQVYMRNVLFKSAGSDDDHFLNCLWDSDPLFYTVRSDYYFNYHVQPDSPAIAAGNPAYVSEICLYDMDGRNRLADGAPCLGAFAYAAEETE